MGDLSFIERQGLKLLGWRLRSMKALKRWFPLLGTAVLAAAVLLRALGQEDIARLLEQAGGLVGLTSEPAVGAAELAAAVAAVSGVVLKLVSEYRKAKQPS